MTFKDIVVFRPYTFGLTLAIVLSTCVALILALPSPVQVRSSVQLAFDRTKLAPITDVETTVKRVSLVDLDLVLSDLKLSDPTLFTMRVEAAGPTIVITSSLSEKLSDAAKAVQKGLIDRILQIEWAEVKRIRREREEALVLTQRALLSLETDRDSVTRDLTQLAEAQKRIAADQGNENSWEPKIASKSIEATETNMDGGGVRERYTERESTALLTLTQRMNFGLILADIKERVFKNQTQLADISNSLAAIDHPKVLQEPTVSRNRSQPSRRGLLFVTALLVSVIVAFLAALTKERFARSRRLQG